MWLYSKIDALEDKGHKVLKRERRKKPSTPKP